MQNLYSYFYSKFCNKSNESATVFRAKLRGIEVPWANEASLNIDFTLFGNPNKNLFIRDQSLYGKNFSYSKYIYRSYCFLKSFIKIPLSTNDM